MPEDAAITVLGAPTRGEVVQFTDGVQGRTTTYLREADALARFEFFDRFGSPILTPSGAVLARHRGTNQEVPVHVVAAHEEVPIADLGDRLIVLIAP